MQAQALYGAVHAPQPNTERASHAREAKARKRAAAAAQQQIVVSGTSMWPHRFCNSQGNFSHLFLRCASEQSFGNDCERAHQLVD
jgi:hypothetical protein